jgi:hypothetical protein
MGTTRRILVSAACATLLALWGAPRAAPQDGGSSSADGGTQYWRLLVGERDNPSQTVYVSFAPRIDGDGWVGTFSNPARGVIGRPLHDIFYGEIAFTLGGAADDASPPSVYRATLAADGRHATGTYSVGERSSPIHMERVTTDEAEAALADGFDAWRRFPIEQSDQIAAALDLEPGMVLADVGAGRGEWAVTLGERYLGPTGHVFATEIDPALLAQTRQLMTGVGVTNVTPILGGATDPGLPDECCDAILLRLVYHEFDDRQAMLAGLRGALRPGGTLAVIEIPGDGEHQIDEERVLVDFTNAGFELVRRFDELDVGNQYCLLFTR